MAGKHPSSYVSEAESLRKRAEFIDLLRGDPDRRQPPLSVRAACDRIGVSRTTVKTWRQTDEDFALAYADAMEDGTDALEDEATRRAYNGVEEPVYQGGELVGHKTVYSDKMLEFILSGRRPGMYRKDTQVNTQINVLPEVSSDRDLAKALNILIEEAKQKQEIVEHE